MKPQVKTSAPQSGYVVAWVEPDVVEIDVTEGADVFRRTTCRVFGMNGPDPKGVTQSSADRTKERAAALTKDKALKFVFLELPDSFLIPPRFKKYGRTVVRVMLPNGADVADVLVDEGYAVPYFMGLGKPGEKSAKR